MGDKGAVLVPKSLSDKNSSTPRFLLKLTDTPAGNGKIELKPDQQKKRFCSARQSGDTKQCLS
jgi:hypothetical protein